MELLLARGASTARVNPHGVTLLATAAFNGEEDVVRSLLAEGVDPAEPDGTGKGPIVYAAGKGYAPIVELLLDAGVDVNRAYAHDLTRADVGGGPCRRRAADEWPRDGRAARQRAAPISTASTIAAAPR